MADIQSPHTNSARLPSYLGRTVRLWVKLLKVIIVSSLESFPQVSYYLCSFKAMLRSYKPVTVVKSK